MLNAGLNPIGKPHELGRERQRRIRDNIRGHLRQGEESKYARPDNDKTGRAMILRENPHINGIAFHCLVPKTCQNRERTDIA
jgi:hypothetical protein